MRMSIKGYIIASTLALAGIILLTIGGTSKASRPAQGTTPAPASSRETSPGVLPSEEPLAPFVGTNTTLYEQPPIPDCGLHWRVVPSMDIDSAQTEFFGATAISANDVWAVGIGGAYPAIEHWDGVQWSVVPNNGIYGSLLAGVSAISASDIWAVGRSYYGAPDHAYIEHWDGSRWSIVPGATAGDSSYLRRVVAISHNDVWAVGQYCCITNYGQTFIEHWDGVQWSVVPSPDMASYSNDLFDISAVSANDIWTVGDYVGATGKPLLLHWDGAAWTIFPVSINGSGAPTTVSAISADDIWAGRVSVPVA